MLKNITDNSNSNSNYIFGLVIVISAGVIVIQYLSIVHDGPHLNTSPVPLSVITLCQHGRAGNALFGSVFA